MKNVLLMVLLLLSIVGGSLGKRNVLKTIASEDGDIIDCVDFFDQPAFSDPMIKNQAIHVSSLMPPPIQQTWQRSGSCPKGTIPILRMKENDTVLTSSIGLDGGAHIEMAIAYDNGGPFQGVSGAVIAWKPDVQPNEYSTNIVACSSGSFPHSVTDVLAAGWTVNPTLFGDHNPRSLIAISKDDNMLLWCYNNKCPGFVQTNHKVVLGGILNSSVYGDINKQSGVRVSIYKDEDHQAWKVSFDEEDIGYILVDEFTDLVHCDATLWGGLVYNSGESPTKTQMGNGHYSNEGVSKTGLITNALVKVQGSYVAPKNVSGYKMTRRSCYDIQGFHSSKPERSPGNMFLYGGPGAQSGYCA